MPLADLQKKCDKFLLICNADSAKSCIKLSRYLGTLLPALHAPCRMHMFNIAMVAAVRMTGMQGILFFFAFKILEVSPTKNLKTYFQLLRRKLQGAMFSSSVLLKRRRVKRTLRRQLGSHVADRLRVVFRVASVGATPTKREAPAVLAFFDNLLKHDSDFGDGTHALMKRHGARKRLRRSLLGPLRDPAIRHHCSIGCHSTASSVRSEIIQDIQTLWIDHPPPVPAWNKWSKVWPVIAWFGSFCAIHDILPSIAGATCDDLVEDFQPRKQISTWTIRNHLSCK